MFETKTLRSGNLKLRCHSLDVFLHLIPLLLVKIIPILTTCTYQYWLKRVVNSVILLQCKSHTTITNELIQQNRHESLINTIQVLLLQSRAQLDSLFSIIYSCWQLYTSRNNRLVQQYARQNICVKRVRGQSQAAVIMQRRLMPIWLRPEGNCHQIDSVVSGILNDGNVTTVQNIVKTLLLLDNIALIKVNLKTMICLVMWPPFTLSKVGVERCTSNMLLRATQQRMQYCFKALFFSFQWYNYCK